MSTRSGGDGCGGWGGNIWIPPFQEGLSGGWRLFVYDEGSIFPVGFIFLSRFRHQGRTFILNLSYPGRTASVKQQIVDMTLNGSGVRDIARVLHISTRTVIAE